MPKRYLISALAIVAAGVATAAASITITASQPKHPRPAPPPPTQLQDDQARAVWRTTPVETLLPPTLDRPGGEQYIRLGIADAAGCSAVLPGPFVDALAKAAPDTTCVKVLRATYTDTTQTILATVGIVVIGGTTEARDKVWREWTPDADAHRSDLMPSVFPVAGTVAADFADSQRIVWDSQASNDGSYLVYTVSGFADGRAGSTPDQLRAGDDKALSADSPPVQAAVDLPQVFVQALADVGKNSGKKP